MFGDQVFEPRETFRATFFQGFPGVYVPVDGLAVLSEAAAEFPYEVGRYGDVPPGEIVFFQGADVVPYGAGLECALEGFFVELAADPRTAQAEFSEFYRREVSSLAADLGGVKREPRRVALPEDLQKSVVGDALAGISFLLLGEFYAGERFARGEEAFGADRYLGSHPTRTIGGAYPKARAEVGFTPYRNAYPDDVRRKMVVAERASSGFSGRGSKR